MGRTPDPIPLKILKGKSATIDNRGREIPTAPPFERGAPEPPDWLSDYARELWEQTAPSLEKLNLLKPDDYSAFVAYCEIWSRYRNALMQVRKVGLVFSGGGRIAHKNPAVSVLEQCEMHLLRYAQQFGLTPAAEVALAKPVKPDDSDDPFSGEATARA